MKYLFIILIFSDATFPIWWIILLTCLLYKGLKAWQAWGITSLIGTAHLYFVTKLIGVNIGAYPLLFISEIPYLFQGNYLKSREGDIFNNFYFWTMPPLFIIIIPTALLYWASSLKKAKEINT